MKLARRGFLRMMPTAAIAVRSTAEGIARDLSKVEIAGLGNNSYGMSVKSQPGQTEAFVRALNMPGLRSQLESYYFESNKTVNRIDPDLAVLRSFSLNAKIAFQRQRNVAAELEQRALGGWDYWSRRLNKILGVTS